MRVQGPFANPEEISFYSLGPKRTDAYLYTVRFFQKALWAHYDGGKSDTIDVDVYEGWLDQPDASSSSTSSAEDGCPPVVTGWAGRGSLLVPVPRSCEGEGPAKKKPRSGGSHGHVHDDGQHHTHDLRPEVEQAAVDREAEHATRVDKDGAFAALHSATVDLLVEKGAVTRDELRRQVELLDAMAYGQTMEGATLVAKAWADESFKVLLLSDAAKAIELAGLKSVVDARGGVGSTRAGIDDLEYMGTAEKGAPPQAVAPIGDTSLVVVENTDQVHNLVVCTLCSCYPRALLGLPPRYYTSRAYRSRCVTEPRAVLAEFGCVLPAANTTVRVHDSTADTRILVLPKRPEGTDGWSEEQLKSLATRDCLVGVALPCVQVPPRDTLE